MKKMTQFNNQNIINWALQSMSSCRGMFKQKFSHHEDMPPNEAEKVINHYQSVRALGH